MSNLIKISLKILFYQQDSLSGANKEAEDNSDSEGDTSDEDENENKPPTHTTQGVKRAAPAQLSGKTKTLRPINY